jgi:hypothetical protein
MKTQACRSTWTEHQNKAYSELGCTAWLFHMTQDIFDRNLTWIWRGYLVILHKLLWNSNNHDILIMSNVTCLTFQCLVEIIPLSDKIVRTICNLPSCLLPNALWVACWSAKEASLYNAHNAIHVHFCILIVVAILNYYYLTSLLVTGPFTAWQILCILRLLRIIKLWYFALIFLLFTV